MNIQVAAVQRNIDGLKEVATNNTTAFAASFGSTMQQLGARSSSYVSEAAAAAQQSETAATAAISSLIQSLEAQTAQLKAFADMQTASTQESLAAVKSMASHVKGTFESECVGGGHYFRTI